MKIAAKLEAGVEEDVPSHFFFLESLAGDSDLV
jgi:hypothetical protein